MICTRIKAHKGSFVLNQTYAVVQILDSLGDLQILGNQIIRHNWCQAKPVVNIVSSRVSTTATNQSIKVIWTAADPDDEELFFSVQYSADGGHTWEIAAHDITEQSITMERPSLHGGRALRIRIWATDGIHTGYDEITSDLEHFLPLIKR